MCIWIDLEATQVVEYVSVGMIFHSSTIAALIPYSVDFMALCTLFNQDPIMFYRIQIGAVGLQN